MKITVYTTPDCTFSASEKAYLQSRNLPFEEKNVKSSEAILTEMLKVGNNFAGTPVTKIVKDDGTEVVLKGFTQSEFDEVLAAKKPESAMPPMGTPAMPGEPKTEAPVGAPVIPPVAGAAPVEPLVPPAVQPAIPPAAQPAMPPVNEAVNAAAAPAAPAVPEQPAQPTNPLDSILRDLQNKVAQESAAAAPQTPPAAGMPTVPDFGSKQ